MAENRRILLAILAILAAIAMAMGLNVDEILAPYSDVLTPSPAATATVETEPSLTPTWDATQDWYDISTLVATITYTETPSASRTAAHTTTPTATEGYSFPTPTQEVWTTPEATVTPDEAHDSRTALILPRAGVNVRLCPNTDCERSNSLPHNTSTHVWYSTCGYYIYNKVFDSYEKVSSGEVRWCQLNTASTLRYWIAVRVGSVDLVEIEGE